MKSYKLINSKADFEPVFFNTEMNFNKARDLCYYIQDASNILHIHLDIILPNEIIFSFLQKFGAVKTEEKDCDFIIDMTNKNSDMVMCALNPNEKNIGSNFYDFTGLDELYFLEGKIFINNEMEVNWIEILLNDKKINIEDIFEDFKEMFIVRMLADKRDLKKSKEIEKFEGFHFNENFLDKLGISTPFFLIKELLKHTKNRQTFLDEEIKSDMQKLLIENENFNGLIVNKEYAYFLEYKNLYNALIKRKLKFNCQYKNIHDHKDCCKKEAKIGVLFIGLENNKHDYLIAPFCEEHADEELFFMSEISFKTAQNNINFELFSFEEIKQGV